ALLRAVPARRGGSGRLAIAQKGTHVLVVATPVVADGHVVGDLLLGREVSGALAARLRALTNSEVSFVSGHRITRTTLGTGEDRQVARQIDVQPGGDAVSMGDWIALARPLPMAADARQSYVLQRSLAAETEFLHSVRVHLFEVGLLLLAAVSLAAFFIS